MGDLVLQACLNGVRLADAHPGLPISPYQLAQDARAVAELGVRSVHVHPRCALGLETIDPDCVGEVIAAIRSVVPAIEVAVPSARWVAPDPARRVEAVHRWGRLGSGARPDVVAVSVHEHGWWQVCAAACAVGIGVEVGVWTPGDAVRLRQGGLPAGVVRVVAEVTVGDPVIAIAEADRILRALGPVRVPVLLHGEDHAAWSVWAHAAAMGLHTRVGLEDMLTRPDGCPTHGNPDLVEHALRTRARALCEPPRQQVYR
ncbi:MAG: 3-keto-5-aminohexanoate cleavage protein [Actinomycetota bacterium]|nr:3-keto-5-aminohexanoate cleavage protein [Actinomycetota bacterium]